MKDKKHLVTAFISLALAVAVMFVSGTSFKKAHDNIPYPEEGPGVTKVEMLSHWFPGLANTNGDTKVYVLEGSEPGGSILVLGGTHANEVSGYLSAFVFCENAVVTKGTVYVIPYTNHSAITHNDPGEGNIQYFDIETRTGTRTFRYGSRATNPIDQWPDPDVYIHYPSSQQLSGSETRNINRTYPGRDDGNLTEKMSYGVAELIRQEDISMTFDLHEASPEYPVINATVAHQDAMGIASEGIANLMIEDNIAISLEVSPVNFHGLTHRELGDYTDTYAILMETANASQGRLRGATSIDQVLGGKDSCYEDSEHIGSAGPYGMLYVPWTNVGEKEGVNQHPIEERVGRHIQGIYEYTQAYNQAHPEAPVEYYNMPTYDDLYVSAPVEDLGGKHLGKFLGAVPVTAPAPVKEAPAAIVEAPAAVVAAPAAVAEAPAAAAEAPAAETSGAFKSPILITSGGQSADYQMIATVMGKKGMEYTMNGLATSADLEGVNTLIVVVGGSSKGLGAAGVDADGELARLTELLDAAKAKGISVIVMHTGGAARRGELSDKFITPIFGYGDEAIILTGGDTDGLMKGLCEEKGIPYTNIEKIAEVGNVLPAMFEQTAAPAAEAAAPAAAPAVAEAAPAAVAEAPAAEAAPAAAQGEGKYKYPILITSGGQSADYQMIATVMGKKNMEYTMDGLATEKNLEGVNTLIVVVGGSSKGLGAAGVDADGELARLTALLDAAKAKGISVIVMHTGGAARRGELSDKFITPIFGYGDEAVILTGGDTDGLMKGICEEKGIPYTNIEKIAEVGTVLPALFSSGAAEAAPAAEAAAPAVTEAAPAAAEAAPAVAEAAPAAEEPAPAAEGKYKYPILITSGGQSADYQMIATVMGKKGMEYTMDGLATEKNLEGINTLIIVVGGSSKGLGAAGVDADGELARINELLSAAKAKDIPVIVMHTGGAARRGELSDKFITPIFSAATEAVILTGGDTDGLMKGICEQNNIPYTNIEKIAEVGTVLPSMF